MNKIIMKKLSAIIITALLFSNVIIAQKVVSTAGNYFQGTNYSLNITIGEPVINTFTIAGGSLSLGFHQPLSDTACNLAVSVNITDALCGNPVGSATANVSGGISPYFYSWSSGHSTATADSLQAGIYTVYVTDSAGCNQFITATISNTDGPAITDTITNVTCNGNSDGAVNITVSGGTSPYTFEWSNGGTQEDLSNLVAGPYEVEVTDTNGCKAIESIMVNEPGALNLLVSQTSASCGVSDGSAVVNISGGISPYTYLWNDLGTQTTDSATGLPAGIYTVLVTDSSGCLDSAEAAISNTGAALITIDSISHAGCGGSGSVFISVSGGTQPYTYTWSNGDTTEDLLNTPGGAYSLSVMSADSCIATVNATIQQTSANPNPICLVTVDTTTGTNLIVWEKQQSTSIAYYNIYKESTQPDVYFLIASVPYDSVSFFTDTFSNPIVRSWRYKIAAMDSCQNESPLSEAHKTIHLFLGDFGSYVYLLWDHYQGFAFTTYYINRYSDANGWEVIDSMPANLFTYTDTAQLTGNVWYYIEAKHPQGCIATAKSKNFEKSRSNYENRLGTTGINNQSTGFNNQLKIYPNPYTGKTNITYILAKNTNVSLEIYSIIGKKIHTLVNENQNAGSYQYEFSASELGYSVGVYLLKLSVNETNITKLLLEIR